MAEQAPYNEEYHRQKEQRRAARKARKIAKADRIERAQKRVDEAKRKGKKMTLRDAYTIEAAAENPPPKPGSIIEQGGRRYLIDANGSRRRVR